MKKWKITADTLKKFIMENKNHSLNLLKYIKNI